MDRARRALLLAGSAALLSPFGARGGERELWQSLRKGGYFMVGATERVGDPAGMGLQTAYPFIYRKAG